MVELVADVAYHTRTNGDDCGRRKEVSSCLEERSEGEEQTYKQQRSGGSHVADELRDVVVGVVGKHFLQVVQRPWHKLCGSTGSLRAEKNLQDGDKGCEREDVEHCREDIEDHRQRQILLVGRDETPQYLEEFFHIILSYSTHSPSSVADVASVIFTITRSPM